MTMKSWIRNPDCFFHKLPEGIVIFTHSGYYLKGNNGFKLLWEALERPVSRDSIEECSFFYLMIKHQIIIESSLAGADFTISGSDLQLEEENSPEDEVQVYAGTGDGFPPSDY